MSSLWQKQTASLNLGRGHPKLSLLDVETISAAVQDIAKDGSEAPWTMQYGSGRGPTPMLDAATMWMSEWGRSRDLSSDRILVTAGASAALNMICAIFTKPGDVVVVEKPSYFLAYGIFKEHNLKIVEVDTDEDGMDLDKFEELLEDGLKPSLVYTVPICSNPKGTSMSAERGARLVHMSRHYGFKIASDEVYFLLQFEDPKMEKSLAEEDDPTNPTVLAMHSMSKTLGPGVRVGWIDAHPTLIDKLTTFGPVVSGGCQSHFMASVVAQILLEGRKPLLDKFRTAYQAGAVALTTALDKYLPSVLGGASFRYYKPRGGYFVWVELPKEINTNELVKLADEKHGVFFYKGSAFCVDGKTFTSCLRLCFAFLEPDEIDQGVKRLANAVEDYSSRNVS
ncbi:hypothetical protein NDN08_005842 [Rhodosorus marinus]|uniref:Aminotransferase class I/classII large domain-containing protein n=1 Tax=Rhodosorus marinus TaxID=101924 RepID=A0AAV8V4E3_9RHOD|nr:hypothetical protein NDN08_005842 [Rhodosorus marinus]